MSGRFTHFRIEGLHDIRTIDVPIKENRLVLVGENGSGKSTVANLIFFFLTNQWYRMLTYKFKTISAILDDQEIKVTREEISEIKLSERFLKKFSLRYRSFAQDFLASRSTDEILSSAEVRLHARNLGIPRSFLYEYVASFSDEDSFLSEKLEKVAQIIKNSITDQVVYLPTYRRIEHELASILHKPLPTESESSLERTAHKEENLSFIELVEFGMQDVDETILRKMSQLKDNLRDDLNNLTGTYLRDVIEGAYKSADLSDISELSGDTIEAIFSRIDKVILPEQHQQRLREIVAKIQNKERITEMDKVAAHFLTKLIVLHETQQENEKDVRDFVKVCNGYLIGKELVYDNLKFGISIVQRDGDSGEGENETRTITMKMLSSGEKQIVSLFSHIYLSGGSGYFIIIDEPELSLSVFWQKRFLTDILATDRCKYLMAVTHSPFIFQNELKGYTHSLDEFMELRK